LTLVVGFNGWVPPFRKQRLNESSWFGWLVERRRAFKRTSVQLQIALNEFIADVIVKIYLFGAALTFRGTYKLLQE
jgi:hypothetical protein